MAQVIGPPTGHSAQPGMQDAVLHRARRERVAVSGHLIDAGHFGTRAAYCDRFVVADIDGADHLIFRHAIAASATECAIARSCSSQPA